MPTVKKTRELRYVSAFLEVRGLADWHIRSDHDEAPDVVVDTPGGVVGIEVTTLNVSERRRGSMAMAGEAMRRQWLDRVARAYYAMGGAPLHVQIVCPRRSAPGEMPRNMVGLLASALCSRRARMRSESSRLRFAMGRSELTIFMRALPDTFGHYTNWQWVSDAIGWVRTVDAERISDRVRKKASKLPQYRQKVNRVLLLIVADRTRASGMFAFLAGC